MVVSAGACSSRSSPRAEAGRASYQALRNAGCVEDAHAPVSEPDRVRITAAGRAALLGEAP